MANIIRKLILAISTLLLFGCAARVVTVQLNAPNLIHKESTVQVKDERLDKQIYMTGISIGAESHIYMLNAEPPLDISLERYIYSIMSNKIPLTAFSKAEVTIDEIDLKNKVGFGKANELLCKMESTLVVYDKSAKSFEFKIKTFVKNDKDMSVLITSSAKEILEPCLQKHASDIYTHFESFK